MIGIEIYYTNPPANPRAVCSDDETELVAGAQRGDAACFEILVRRYERKLFRLAKNVTQNPSDAEEVLQDAFLKAYTHLSDFRGNSRFYTWMVRITINQALMKLRKRRPGHFSLDEPVQAEDDFLPRQIADWGPNPEQRYSQKQIAGILARVMADLHPALRIVFQLREIEKLSTEETAETLGLSIPAVKSRLLRARLRLRQKLNPYFGKRARAGGQMREGARNGVRMDERAPEFQAELSPV